MSQVKWRNFYDGPAASRGRGPVFADWMPVGEDEQLWLRAVVSTRHASRSPHVRRISSDSGASLGVLFTFASRKQRNCERANLLASKCWGSRHPREKPRAAARDLDNAKVRTIANL